MKRKFDEVVVVVEKEKVGSKKNKNEHTVESDTEKNNTMSSGPSENLDSVAKKITSFILLLILLLLQSQSFKHLIKNLRTMINIPFQSRENNPMCREIWIV